MFMIHFIGALLSKKLSKVGVREKAKKGGIAIWGGFIYRKGVSNLVIL